MGAELSNMNIAKTYACFANFRHFWHIKIEFFFKIPEITLLPLPCMVSLPCMVFSKNVPKVVLRYRDLNFAHVPIVIIL